MSSMNKDGEKPVLHYWHAWANDEGVSQQTQCELTDFARESMGGAAAQWNDNQQPGQARIVFSVLPANWSGDWHENPEPQWIVPLSGRWFVETMDGTRVEMGAGDISFGGDQGCVADDAGHQGHRSGTLGGEPAVLMLVQLDRPPEDCKPGAFA